MCPACITTLVLAAAGALSTGGLATLRVKKGLAPAGAKTNATEGSKEKEQGGE